MTCFEDLVNFFSDKLKTEINTLGQREPKKLYEPVVYSLNMGGKRLRPALLLMAYQLYKNDLEKALPAAFAIELFHNFTLLHDDIMDNASLRRNIETIHIKYSNNAAILSGDAMSILSYEYISKCQTNRYQDLIALYTDTALKICEGQQFDMDFETTSQVTVDEYLTMIGLKTAVLLAASLKIGALLADATEKDARLLYELGYNLGMAFQLQDDLLDTFGDQNEFGKNIGGDICLNKKTFLLINALKIARDEQLTELEKWISATHFDKSEKIERVRRIYVNLGIAEITKDKIDSYFQVFQQKWEQLNVNKQKKECLLVVANKLMSRQN